MNETQFVRNNQPRWNEFEKLLKKKTGRYANPQEAWGFPHAYRMICRDLNLAKSERFSLNLIDTLNRYVWEGHRILYKARTAGLSEGLRFAGVFASRLRRFGLAFFLCHALFYGIVGLTFLYGLFNPSQIESFLGEDMMDDLEYMYDPKSEHLLKPRDVDTDADMFGYYIFNNISIGFRTFAGGILAGFGSLFFLVYNALFMGAAMSFINASGLNLTFYQFVLGHGAFELTAMVIFGLAGFEFGSVIIKPGRNSRSEGLRKKGLDVLPLVTGATIFLIIAACIEAFWSSKLFEPGLKFIFAGFTWLLVYSYILFGGRHGRS